MTFAPGSGVKAIPTSKPMVSASNSFPAKDPMKLSWEVLIENLYYQFSLQWYTRTHKQIFTPQISRLHEIYF